METKNFWESKTFWANLIGAPLAWAVTHFGLDISPDLQAGIITGVLGAMNIVLRFMSSGKIVLGQK